MGLREFTHEGFHGYWIHDFQALEPHFGTVAHLKSLVAAAHERGIKVLLDVVYNHAGYASTYSARATASGEAWIRVGEGNCYSAGSGSFTVPARTAVVFVVN